jgi:hypothetical protein
MSDKSNSQERFEYKRRQFSREQFRSLKDSLTDTGIASLTDLRGIVEEQLERLKDAKEQTRGPSKSTQRRVFRWFFVYRKPLGADVVPPKGALIDWLVPPDRADDMLLALRKAYEERWVCSARGACFCGTPSGRSSASGSTG